MKLRYRLGLGIALAAMATSPAMARDPSGTYTRPNGDVVRVWITDNKLYCRIIEGNRPDFESKVTLVVRRCGRSARRCF